jgi:uncharacterized membrane protein YgcG
MTRSILICFATCLTALSLAQPNRRTPTFDVFAYYPYVIDEFDVEIDLRKDATMTVTERIAVTFNQERRGIFRTIPVDYDARFSLNRRVLLDVKSVTDERGTPYTKLVTREGEYVKIRIGDENIFLPAGTKRTYVITYTAIGMVNWFEKGHDWEPYAELYWNVTGDEWDTAIRTSRLRLRFPSSPEGKGVRARVFAGPLGSTLQHTVSSLGSDGPNEDTQTSITLRENEVEVSRSALLEPGEGVTIALNVPAQLIEKYSTAAIMQLWVLPNLGFLLPIPVFLISFVVWLRKGRDPKSGPVVVQYDPPDGISGPEAGALIDERVQYDDVAAGFVSLAVKGYLRISSDKDDDYSIVLTDKQDGFDLTVFETALLKRLRSVPGDSVTESDLRSHVAPHMPSLQSKLYATLVKDGYYRKSPESARNTFGCIGCLGVIVVAVLLVVMTPLHPILPSIVGGVISLIIVGVFSSHMPLRTANGVSAHSKVLGFYEFISRARGQELEWESKKSKTPEVWEAFLPHAIAFGLAKPWTEAFEGVLHAPPEWYTSPHGRAFSSHMFARDMNRMSTDIGHAASTPPRSSGASGGSSGFSSGGGFSGGGFGGGGGGSW